jgi:hypothetical protein
MCEAEIPEVSDICPECGAPVGSVSDDQFGDKIQAPGHMPKKKYKSKTTAILVLIFSLIVAASCSFMLYLVVFSAKNLEVDVGSFVLSAGYVSVFMLIFLAVSIKFLIKAIKSL